MNIHLDEYMLTRAYTQQPLEKLANNAGVNDLVPGLSGGALAPLLAFEGLTGAQMKLYRGGALHKWHQPHHRDVLHSLGV